MNSALDYHELLLHSSFIHDEVCAETFLTEYIVISVLGHIRSVHPVPDEKKANNGTAQTVIDPE